jgi:hypothetical protein
LSTDPTAQATGPTTAPQGASGEPSEEELRAAYEAELSRITPADMMLQAAVSLLNIGARRLGLTGGADPADSADAGAAGGARAGGGRDLVQVRDAIDGVRALLGVLEHSVPEELRPLRDALSQLQLAYAREAQASGGKGAGAGERSQPQKPKDAPDADDRERAPGPAQASGRLWVPGS